MTKNQPINWPQFRRWLDEQMRKRGFSYRRADVCRETNIRPATLSAWFNEKRRLPNPPSLESIEALARWAKVDPPAIYAILEVPPPTEYDAWVFRVTTMLLEGKGNRRFREAIAREVQSIHGAFFKRDRRPEKSPSADK